jgi:hypothetical protein
MAQVEVEVAGPVGATTGSTHMELAVAAVVRAGCMHRRALLRERAEARRWEFFSSRPLRCCEMSRSSVVREALEEEAETADAVNLEDRAELAAPDSGPHRVGMVVAAEPAEIQVLAVEEWAGGRSEWFWRLASSRQ